MMNLDKHFPRYVRYGPIVPVWCVTPDRNACIHRFFDTSPISPSGRYLAVFQLPHEDRRPSPGDVGHVCLIDLETGEDRIVAESRGWESQMGANLNWGGSDRELFFNDVDTSTWEPFARKLDVLSGKIVKMGGTVYHASHDGRFLISANMTTMRKTQPGYGVVVPPEVVRRNIGPADGDGFTLTDTRSGESRLLVSIADLLKGADPPVRLDDPDRHEIYGFHSKFNARGDRLMVSLRAFPAEAEPIWDMFGRDHEAVRFAWVTLSPDGSAMHCPIGPEQWAKGGHHATWMPDGRRISMNLNIDRQGLRFVEVNQDGSNLHKMLDDVPGSGHPTVHVDGRHLLTDTYTNEPAAFGDGTVPLRWIDLSTGWERTVLRVNTKQPCPDSALRVDPHPAWDRTWRYVTFNAYFGGTRRVFIADMTTLIDGQ